MGYHNGLSGLICRAPVNHLVTRRPPRSELSWLVIVAIIFLNYEGVRELIIANCKQIFNIPRLHDVSLMIFTDPVTALISHNCSTPGYVGFNIGEPGSCYRYYPDLIPQYAASTRCLQDSARLISINSTETLGVIKTLIGYCKILKLISRRLPFLKFLCYLSFKLPSS